MDRRQFSPSTARNREPILAVLQRVLPPRARVLELASGAGEHAVSFAAALPGTTWRPSDPDADARASISAWIAHQQASNVEEPLAIDVCANHWGVEAEAPFDALVAINMIHISPWPASLGLMAGAGRLLRRGGVLFTYGPYTQNGRHTAASNAAFDASLRARNPLWGVRDIAALESAAQAQGLALHEIIDMPANNYALVFVRT